jgi:cytochrome c oxidase assembly protein subunit 15
MSLDATAPSNGDALDHRRRLTRRLALVCAGLMLATIVLSAFMRLSQSGLGCEGWPDCYAQALQAGRPDGGGHGVALARLLHRIVASAVLVLVMVLVAATLFTRPRLGREGSLSLTLLLLALALAALGVVTRGATLPAVVLGNLLGGFAMLALCGRLAAVAGGQADSPPVLARWARLGLLLLLGQAALGALIGAGQAALACGGWSECLAAARSAGWDWRHLSPWQAPAPDAAAPGHPRGVWLQLLHRSWALVLLPVLALVALHARRHGQRTTSLALITLLALQLLLGGLLAPAGLPLVQVLLHNLAAALMLTLLARLA